jgi:integrase
MGLQLKVDGDGTCRPHWYGVYEINKVRRVINLAVPIEGKPPASLRVADSGDSEFERSRKKAQKVLDIHVAEDRQKGRADHLTERLIASKTGQAIEYVKIADLAHRWRELGRETPPSEQYLAACDAAFERFATFAKNATPPATNLYAVTSKHAASYVENLQATYARKTCRDHIKLLRRSFSTFMPIGSINPFASFVGRRGNGETGTIHRRPFTPEELTTLLKTAQGDAFLFPLVTAAACTGMRRGDLCRLRWRDFDFKAGVVAVKTSKTGAQVEIPIFPPLQAILSQMKPGSPEAYVFPEAAHMIEQNPDGLTWRFKVLVAQSFSQPQAPEHNDKCPPPPQASAEQLRAEGLAAIDRMPEGKRREHTRDTFLRYMAGASVRTIAKETGLSSGSVSGWLSDVSIMLDKPVVRARTDAGLKAAISKHTRVNREEGDGQRAASIRDWHALRATWVTLALSAGVPMELVRRVTGHATVDIVLRYYFHPDREDFKAVLSERMPAVLTGAVPMSATGTKRLAPHRTDPATPSKSTTRLA